MIGVTRAVVEFMGLVTEVGVAVKVTLVVDDCAMEVLGVELDPSVMGVTVGKVEALGVKLDSSVVEVGVDELELLGIKLDP